MRPRERHASLRRAISGPRQMHEDRTAGPLNPRTPVVVQHDNDIVKMVRAPKTLRARGIGMAHPAIVVAVPNGIAPAVVRLDTSDRQGGRWPLHAIGAVEHQLGPPGAARGCSVALMLSRRASASPQRAGQDQRCNGKRSANGRTRARTNMERATSMRVHIVGIASTSTLDCHLFPDSCFRSATSDMVPAQISPIRSPAT